MNQNSKVGVWLVCALSLGLGACATTVTLPGNRLESPEAVGEGAFRLDPIGLQGGHEVEFTPNALATGFNSSDPTINQRSTKYRLDTGYGVANNFDLALKLQANTPPMLQGKYQFIGEPRAVATEGNFSVAATAALGYSSESQSAGTATSDTKFYAIDFGGIAGYRITNAVLAYGGVFTGIYPVSSEQQLPGAASKTKYSSNPYNLGMNVGIGVDYGALDLKLEGAVASAHAGNTSKTNFEVGFKLGFALGSSRSTSL